MIYIFWIGVALFFCGINVIRESWTDLGEFIGLAMLMAACAAVSYSLFSSP